MSLEATAYVQAALALYLAILCLYLPYDYYGNVYKSEDSALSKGPFSKHIFGLFISLTLFTFLSSFFIGFLYNNAFNIVDDETILNSYCQSIMNTNIFWFYFHTICIFLILSYFIENMLRVPNNNNKNYNFMNAYYIYYRIIIIIINIYLPIHIISFIHNNNISTNMEWKNYSTSFVLCELNSNGNGHIALLVIFQIICYSITIIPLIPRYKQLLIDHKDITRKDDNESYIHGVQMVIFYVVIQLLFEIIFLSIFVKEPRVSGFILIFVLIIRTTCIYCIGIETKSYIIFYKYIIRIYIYIWNKISPLKDPEEVDPNWRWYHKQEKTVDTTQPSGNDVDLYGNNNSEPNGNNNGIEMKRFKSKTSTRALSNGVVTNGSKDNIYQQAQNEDIDVDEEFNDENSVAFSKISKHGESQPNITMENDNDDENENENDAVIIDDLDNMKQELKDNNSNNINNNPTDDT